ncbi:MAG: phosphoribosylaminoimidazolesuccinocarboxamide synthase [Defluviitaleaceae bacterium]|nr:phosphoribosylaminoimidazolesuccinocarboxamide synthase [Defluviitaleaceae bacterium]
MIKNEKLYEGKVKIIYKTNEQNILWIEYKNSVTAFNGLKKDEIVGKAILNNKISSLIFEKLNEKGIENHFIKELSDTEQLVKKVKIIPLEVVIRNIVAGSMSVRLGIEEGTILENPIIDFHYKNDELNDPLITLSHIKVLKILEDDQIKEIEKKSFKINEVLKDIFDIAHITLVDFKLEFGLDEKGEILLADEISPDTCRLWQVDTNERLDKDVYRKNIGDLLTAYEKVYEKLKSK